MKLDAENLNSWSDVVEYVYHHIDAVKDFKELATHFLVIMKCIDDGENETLKSFYSTLIVLFFESLRRTNSLDFDIFKGVYLSLLEQMHSIVSKDEQKENI